MTRLDRRWLCAPACFLVSLASACSSAGNFHPAEVTYERSAKAMEMPIEAMRAGPSDVGDYTCSYADRKIQYNGATTLQLINCLLEAPPETRTLVMTSSGGNADLAIFAAYVIRDKALDLEIVGWCASACANYILPAGRRVYLDQHSAVFMHASGPQPPNREETIEALARSGFTSDHPNYDRVIEDNVKRSELTYRLHNNFKKDFGVGDGYHDLRDVWSGRTAEGQEPPTGMIFVDPDQLKRCLPRVRVIAEAPNRDALERLFPDYSLVSASDVRGAQATCAPA